MELNATQFQGGGFVSASQGGNGTTPEKKANYNSSNNQTLRAVTVQQLVKGTAHTTDDQYEIDGAPLHNITMVGELVSVNTFSMNVDMVLFDGTGTVKVQHWLSSDGDGTMEEQPSTWQVGAWVRIYGSLRRIEDEVSIVSYHIRPIASWTEALLYHNLQVMHQHIHLLKGGGRGTGGAGAGLLQSPAPGGFGTAAVKPFAGGGGFVGMGGDGGLSAVQSAINDFLNSPEALNQSEGVALSDITSKFGSRFDRVAIQKACEWLVDEGHAFDVGDNYFKSTSAQ
mmetsp:Transcript_9496/g.28555  ORF Transcript_9496/g.28555 Transcript_9496/m.28555 type:complete len:283 (-) Transcript_9496:1004-1852(-)|eukprot:CAMPEP_0206151946 /NCGR_PEP_ID=MMETSP1473-20131121/39076_1 /ASSEMBLY_ACC=CAM_ASM_001109 /TAXON_ID=1461547 /ORGANISM="Stichococcus sp, Strain RCC1054" /LENGTH=282 /DNA_ID=CAMNT_0053549497 /DNA_START=103 /DNA_END=951 /DNA_ORIENTATION=-